MRISFVSILMLFKYHKIVVQKDKKQILSKTSPDICSLDEEVSTSTNTGLVSNTARQSKFMDSIRDGKGVSERKITKRSTENLAELILTGPL